VLSADTPGATVYARATDAVGNVSPSSDYGYIDQTAELPRTAPDRARKGGNRHPGGNQERFGGRYR
jgi:hypothetical protein